MNLIRIIVPCSCFFLVFIFTDASVFWSSVKTVVEMDLEEEVQSDSSCLNSRRLPPLVDNDATRQKKKKQQQMELPLRSPTVSEASQQQQQKKKKSKVSGCCLNFVNFAKLFCMCIGSSRTFWRLFRPIFLVFGPISLHDIKWCYLINYKNETEV